MIGRLSRTLYMECTFPSSPKQTLSGLLQIQHENVSFFKTIDLPPTLCLSPPARLSASIVTITLLFPFTVQSTEVHFYPPVSKVHAGSFCVSVIHRSLTWVCSYACVYTQGWGTPTTSQHNILTRKNSHKCFLCSGRDSYLWS